MTEESFEGLPAAIGNDNAPTAEPTNDNASAQETVHQNNKPAGYEPIDPNTATPEQVGERLNYLFRQVKEGQRDRQKSQREFDNLRQIAEQQAQLLEQMQNGMGTVVNHIQGQSFASEENRIKSQMQTALDGGDTKAYVDAQADLIALQNKRQQPLKPVQRQPQQPQLRNASGIANDAVNNGELAPQDAAYVNAWMNESDDSGEPLRPWAQNTGTLDNPDPDYIYAMLQTKRIYESNPNLTAQQLLSEVDKRMSTKIKPRQQTVMGANLTTARKSNTVKLTPEQENLAIKTKFGSHRGAKTNAEYLAAYRKQLETVKQGVRR